MSIKKPVNANTDYLSIHVYAVFDNVKEHIQILVIDGPGTDVSQISTGSIKGETYFDKNKKPITISDIDDVYMVVEWQDEVKGIRMKETIDLYNQENLLN